MLDTLIDAFEALPTPVAVAALAMLPITELRLALPIGALVFDQPVALAAVYAVLGNLVPITVLVFGLEPVTTFLRRWRWFDRLMDRVFAVTRSRHEARFARYRDLALVLLVAVPVPGTGGYSGALAAYVFGVAPRRAFPLVSLGIMLSAVIVAVLVASGTFLFGVSG